ncbi:helix-turn-helix domain-containing protein [Undibacterium rugosum]|uniref:helix-turn-helix domain-containing protein n=1 Tax=Undibacterium rugosum TaxID=2762291 RepID=UPI001B824F78|nr:helix-turn-helix domain-containing protein [Undibacterium rugosum]MBR7778193.1 DUF4115 domain-containing protein [Undibacterium rugosum]
MSEGDLDVVGDVNSSDVAAKETDLKQDAGRQLAQARSRMGLSVEQVAEHLKLSPKQIQAIEDNAFNLLPEMVIVRGFIRSYAKLVKLDAQALLASLPATAGYRQAEADFRPTLATPFLESKTRFLARSDQTNRHYLVGAVLLGLAALLFVAVQKLEQTEWFARQLASFHAPVTQPVTEPAPASVVSESVVASQPSTSPSVNPAQPEKSLTEILQAPASVAKDVPAEVEAAPVKDVQTPAQDNVLTLKFRQDSWVQVKKENGEVLASRVFKAGSEEKFDLSLPLQLRIGNAAGVDVVVRGAAMPVAVNKETNVINLNIK